MAWHKLGVVVRNAFIGYLGSHKPMSSGGAFQIKLTSLLLPSAPNNSPASVNEQI